MSLTVLFLALIFWTIFHVPSGLLSSTTMISFNWLPKLVDILLMASSIFSFSLYDGKTTDTRGSHLVSNSCMPRCPSLCSESIFLHLLNHVSDMFNLLYTKM